MSRSIALSILFVCPGFAWAESDASISYRVGNDAFTSALQTVYGTANFGLTGAVTVTTQRFVTESGAFGEQDESYSRPALLSSQSAYLKHEEKLGPFSASFAAVISQLRPVSYNGQGGGESTLDTRYSSRLSYKDSQNSFNVRAEQSESQTGEFKPAVTKTFDADYTRASVLGDWSGGVSRRSDPYQRTDKPFVQWSDHNSSFRVSKEKLQFEGFEGERRTTEVGYRVAPSAYKNVSFGVSARETKDTWGGPGERGWYLTMQVGQREERPSSFAGQFRFNKPKVPQPLPAAAPMTPPEDYPEFLRRLLKDSLSFQEFAHKIPVSDERGVLRVVSASFAAFGHPKAFAMTSPLNPYEAEDLYRRARAEYYTGDKAKALAELGSVSFAAALGNEVARLSQLSVESTPLRVEMGKDDQRPVAATRTARYGIVFTDPFSETPTYTEDKTKALTAFKVLQGSPNLCATPKGGKDGPLFSPRGEQVARYAVQNGQIHPDGAAMLATAPAGP